MTTNEIRTRFLKFFESKKHTIVASDSLVPKDDPTVLFTTAGMQQFKRQFLGHIEDYARATTSQKCLRTDDLDKVGKTDCHHTFFEMLGNFSFGDYFKKEAITWAWEFFTKELKIPAEKLWVSVYKDDGEAKEIWLKDIKIDPKKFIALGDKSNFWPSEAKEKGPNGPCGPCSEIFYDYGVNPNCPQKDQCDPDCSCGRFSEIWNLVFTQFNRKDGGILEPLPSKNIDTGMGLERLAAVIQGKKNNFETDVFTPIIKAINEKINTENKLSKSEIYVIADHIRAICFGTVDGVIPSNEGRGYVIKRLIIDITDIGLKTGKSEAKIYQLVPAVIEAMKGPYPEIVKKETQIASVIRNIEESYIKIKKERVPELKNKLMELQKLPSAVQVSELGKTMFIYRDTFGLTLSTINATIKVAGITTEIKTLADAQFKILMEGQQEKSRAGSKMTGDVFAGSDLKLDVPKTKFLGYETLEVSAKILALVNGDQKIHEAGAGPEIKIILDQTPFYAEAGGQIGDTGFMEGPSGKIRVTDTQKMDDIYIHSAVVEKGKIKVNESVTAKVDGQRRFSIMRNHTATHLLQAALRQILGPHVQQQGSLVSDDKLRFDFTQPKPISTEEMISIEQKVNAVVSQNIDVTVEKLKLDEAKKKGALAFFAEKYGQEVRVVSIGDFSKEFCGGTHLKNTADIELFKITSQGSVAQGIRRLEAKTGLGAKEYIKEKQKKQIQREDLNKLRAAEEEKEKKRFSEILKSVHEDIKSSPVVNGTILYTKKIEHMDVNHLKKIADAIKQVAQSSAIVLGTHNETSASIIIAISDDLVERGIKANDLIKNVAPLINGTGGGRPQLAQAGSKEVGKVDAAIIEATHLIKEKIKK